MQARKSAFATVAVSAASAAVVILAASAMLQPTPAQSAVASKNSLEGLRPEIAQRLERLPDTLAQHRSLAQLARALDATTFVNVGNVAAVREAGRLLTEAINCVWEVYPYQLAHVRIEKVQRLAIDTTHRRQAYADYNRARSGSVIALPSSEASTCE